MCILPALSQEALPPSDTTPTEVSEEKHTDVKVTNVQITLANGIVLSGSLPFDEIVYWQPDSEEVLHFTSADGQESMFPSNRISDIKVLSSTPEPPEAEATISEPQKTIPAQEESTTNTVTDTVVEPPIETKTPEGFSFSNPAASRYLYAPSSIGLQEGQGYVSQKLVFTTGVFAVTKLTLN